MSSSGVLVDPLGKVGDLGKQVGKGIGSEAERVEKTTRKQVGLENQEDVIAKNADNAQDQASNADPSIATLEVVKKMYEQSEHKVSTPSDETISKVIEENPKKTPEEIQKIASTRQQLWQQQHNEVYANAIINPSSVKRKEPRPAEEIEREEKEKKQMEALELQKEEKKKEELSPAVKQGTVERHPGASG